MSTTALVFAVGLGLAIAAPGCSFVPDRDYSDPAGPVLTSSTPEECCQKCLGLPSCLTAVFAGQACYTKLGSSQPYAKPNQGVVSCVTNRTAPKPPAIKDTYYDCRFRQLALDHADQVVLGPDDVWSPTSPRRAAALQAVANGLRIRECNISAPARASAPATAAASETSPGRGGAAPATELFVAPDGDDSAAGTSAAPLATISGAQARIRARYPPGSTSHPRPAVNIFLRPGDYYLPPRRGSLSSRTAGPVFASFGAADSGADAQRPITYAAEPGSAEGGGGAMPTLHGGVLLQGLQWAAAPRSTSLPLLPAGTQVATLPEGISIDPQDQLYLGDTPLVRARTPNGRPWQPLDGFNLTAAVDEGCGTMPGVPRVFTSCTPPTPAPPAPYPGSDAPAAPAAPAVGKCSAAVENASLLYGFPKPDLVLGATVPSAAACAAACAAQDCCSGWTWHDATCGGYEFRCYFVANPLQVWSRAVPQIGHYSGLCNHGDAATEPCNGAVSPRRCFARNVSCADTGRFEVDGLVGDATLGDTGDVQVKRCFEHAPNMGNSWPHWKGAAFGRIDQDNATYSFPNMMDLTQNVPTHFGPWAGGMVVHGGQDVGVGATPLSKLQWNTAAGTVVHAMADFEWGSVQFEVAEAERINASDVRLHFRRGGWQQARGATLGTNNRYYMEGNVEFLDAELEWHFDNATRKLYIVPPAGARLGSPSQPPLLLTQTDCLLKFEGDGSADVQHVRVQGLRLAHTSASFFLPHEETSGGDYAITRSAAVFLENASHVALSGCELSHVGGNGVFLSNAVHDVNVTGNHLSFLGTSGVSLVGRTGAALMDARDGQAMVAAATAAGAVDPAAADNGVRLPQRNAVRNNVIHDYGVWSKQSAAYHKALAPGNDFSRNAVFNASRHGVNFQDSMGGGSVVDGNVFFALNRETGDTAALNSWGRRNYVFSGADPGPAAGAATDPAAPQLVPGLKNSWRNNLVLGRPLGEALGTGGKYAQANCLRCDDGASWYNMTNNVCYGSKSAMEFNGGTQVYTKSNLFVQGGWTLCASPPMVGGGSHDVYIDAPRMWSGLCGDDKCRPFWLWNITNQTAAGSKPARYTGDYNTIVVNSTGAGRPTDFDLDGYFCGLNMSTWSNLTKGDGHTTITNSAGSAEWSPDAVLLRARRMLMP